MVEFIKCKDCVSVLKIFNSEIAKEHYDTRKKVKRCIGCDQLKYYYSRKIQPFETGK